MTFLRFFALRSASSTTRTTDRSIARSVALSPVVVSLRETVDEIWVEITSMIYTVCSYKMSFSKIFPLLDPVWFRCAIGFFFFFFFVSPVIPIERDVCVTRR